MFEILSQLLFEELSKKLIEGTATREERERYVSDATLTRQIRAKLADYVDGRVRKAGEGEQLALALEAAQERASEIAGVPIEDLDAPACPVLDFHGRECLTGPTGHKGDHVYSYETPPTLREQLDEVVRNTGSLGGRVYLRRRAAEERASEIAGVPLEDLERTDLPPTLTSQMFPPLERARSGPGAGLNMIADTFERETMRRGRELHEQLEQYVQGEGASFSEMDRHLRETSPGYRRQAEGLDKVIAEVFEGEIGRGQRLYGMTDGMRYEPSGPVLATVPDPTPYPVKAGCALCRGESTLPGNAVRDSSGVGPLPVADDSPCPACGGSGASL